MPRIHVLEESIARKIAAGEVVERPASVVKELVENSIDAGASNITVEIREGGISYLRVTDNGCGIAQEDVEVAFLRHATSKLENAEQLFDVRQMGFRGEALYSIAAVSRLEMNTKPATQEIGMQILLEGGQVLQCKEHGCPDGTTLIVRDLFFNTPARLKFLSKPSSEASAISAMIARLILARPDISIKYISNARTVYHSIGDGDLRNAVFSVFGKETAQGLIAVHASSGLYTLDGYVGIPENVRSSRSQQLLCVNHRPITHLPISRAVEDAYGGILGGGKYPVFMLNLAMPTDQVDVNVHPNKLQVRFLEEGTLRLLAYRAVAEAVGRQLNTPATIDPVKAAPTATAPHAEPYSRLQQPTHEKAPMASHTNETDLSWSTAQTMPVREATEPRVKSVASNDSVAQMETVSPDSAKLQVPAETAEQHDGVSAFLAQVRNATKQADPTQRALAQQNAVPTMVLRSPTPEEVTEIDEKGLIAQSKLTIPGDVELPQLLGVAFQTYILLQDESTIYVIDQHAAHERLLYERYLHALTQAEVVSQPLLLPQNLDVTFDEQTLLEDNLPLFAELGFELESYGRLSYLIRAVPMLLGTPAPRDLLRAMFSALQSGKPTDAATLKRERLMSMACRHAIKAGDTLSVEDIQALMKLIATEKTPLSCPHGRPIVLMITKSALERHFKRTK